MSPTKPKTVPLSSMRPKAVKPNGTENLIPPVAEVPKEWDRCHAFLPQKRRFCRQRPPSTEMRYCGNHQHLDPSTQFPLGANNPSAASSGSTSSRTDLGAATVAVRKRIPCPLDPTHWIFEDAVDRHVRVCPAATKQRRLEKAMYYQHNINGGGHGQQVTARINPMAGISGGSTSLRWAHQVARRVLLVHQSIFVVKDRASNGGEKCVCDVTKITFQDIYDAIPMNDMSKDIDLLCGLERGFQSHHVKSGGVRHIPQLASLIGHLQQMNVLPPKPDATKVTTETTAEQKRQRQQQQQQQQQEEEEEQQQQQKPPPQQHEKDKDESLLLVEMGAGRGMFGLTAAGVACARGKSAVRLNMVERAGSRSRADKAFRNIPADADNSYLRLDGVGWSRLTCDLAHFNLPVVLEKELRQCGSTNGENNVKVAVIAKHLCGAGTDLALKSIASIRPHVKACILATCCHGICDWEHYVGREYLRQVFEGTGKFHNDTEDCNDGADVMYFGQAEFDLIRHWCAASTSVSQSVELVDEGRQESVSGILLDDDKEEPEHAPISSSIGMKNKDENSIRSSPDVSITSVVRDLNLACGIQGLGRACQRLIDYGRLLYIRHEIFNTIDGRRDNTNAAPTVTLSHYVCKEVTPQNAALWAFYPS